jgi:hypothetical protein
MEMKMFKYNQNTGEIPKLKDRVEICRTDSEMDGMTGTIQGWYGEMNLIALVAVDTDYAGCGVVSMPVVCLKPYDGRSPMVIRDAALAENIKVWETADKKAWGGFLNDVIPIANDVFGNGVRSRGAFNNVAAITKCEFVRDRQLAANQKTWSENSKKIWAEFTEASLLFVLKTD